MRISFLQENLVERGTEVPDEASIAESLPEQDILIQSVCETMVPKLVAEDIPLLFSLLNDVFPNVGYTRAEMTGKSSTSISFHRGIDNIPKLGAEVLTHQISFCGISQDLLVTNNQYDNIEYAFSFTFRRTRCAAHARHDRMFIFTLEPCTSFFF